MVEPRVVVSDADAVPIEAAVLGKTGEEVLTGHGELHETNHDVEPLLGASELTNLGQYIIHSASSHFYRMIR